MFSFIFAMTLDKARDLLQTQADFGVLYHRHGLNRFQHEVMREHRQSAVGQLITELNLTEIFQFQAGEVFESSY